GGAGPGRGRRGLGSRAQPLERAREVAHRQRQGQGPAEVLAVLVVELARPLGHGGAGGGAGGAHPPTCSPRGAGSRVKPAAEDVTSDAQSRPANQAPGAPPVVILGGGLTGI